MYSPGTKGTEELIRFTGYPHFRCYNVWLLINGNAIRTGAKRPLKRDFRVSEVRNSGVPLCSQNV